MSMDPVTVTPVVGPAHPILRALALVLISVGVVLALSLVFGVAAPGSLLPFAPDPAGTMPF